MATPIISRSPRRGGRWTTFRLYERFRSTPVRLFGLFCFLVWIVISTDVLWSSKERLEIQQLRHERWHRYPRPSMVQVSFSKDDMTDRVERKLQRKLVHQQASPCPIRSMHDLSKDELYPKKGPRHMVTPPKGGVHSLACCTTTAGLLSLVIHQQWAPHGARRARAMIKSGYFRRHANDNVEPNENNKPKGSVPIAKCIDNILCQFGLHSDPQKSQNYHRHTIPDDVNWLPEGPTHRTNAQGVKRYAKGYLGFAGAGPNSRTNQWIVALEDNERLGGGSPWEVP